MIVYNIPKFTHVMLQDSTLRALADHERIVGFKDSSGDLKVFAGFRAAVPRAAALVGGGSLLYPALEMGARGRRPRRWRASRRRCAPSCWRAFRAGDLVAAGARQERLTPLHKEIVVALGARRGSRRRWSRSASPAARSGPRSSPSTRSSAPASPSCSSRAGLAAAA